MSGVDSAPSTTSNLLAGGVAAGSSRVRTASSQAISLGLSVWHEHRVVLALGMGYVATAGLLLTSLDRPWPVRIVNWWFTGAWTALSAAWLCWQLLKGTSYLRAAVAPPRLCGAILVALLALPVQISFQALKQSIGPVIGFPADPWLHQLDIALHGQVAWLWLEPLLDAPWWLQFIDLLYMAWFVGLIAFVVWAGWSRHRALRQRALVAFLLLWIGGGTISAAFGASAGPCYFGQIVSASNPYTELTTRLDAIASPGNELLARRNQRMLWDFHRTHQWAPFGGISAMPSMHVALAVLFALVAWQCSRVVGALLWAYAIVIQIGSIILAWHYAVDGYAGAMLAVISWSAASSVLNRVQQREPFLSNPVTP